MTQFNPLIPRQQVPALSLPMVGGGSWTLSEQNPENFTMLVVYRGLHCPACSRYLGELNGKVEDFAKRGVEIFIASSDGQERAEEAKEKWKLDNLSVGYGLTLDKGREWGLFISASRGKSSIGVEEPVLFLEPGLFLIRPNQELFLSSVQTMPFARPHFSEILNGLDFMLENNYLGRGEVVDHTAI